MRPFRLALAALLFTAPVVTARADDPAPIKLLIITGDHGHDWAGTTRQLEDFLAKGGRIKVDVTTTPAKDLTPENLAKYDVYLLNYKETKPTDATKWTDANKEALLDAVRGGKGLVVYHFASSAFPDWEEYEKLISGGWRKQGFHGPKHVFTVKKTDADSPISKGLPSEFTHVIDELYQNSKMLPGASCSPPPIPTPTSPAAPARTSRSSGSITTARAASITTPSATMSRPSPTPCSSNGSAGALSGRPRGRSRIAEEGDG